MSIERVPGGIEDVPGGDPADLQLGPATRLLWRGPDEFHLELGTRAVLLTGLPPRIVRLLAARDPAAPAVGRADPSTGDATDASDRTKYAPALAELTRAGFLWTRSYGAPDARQRPPVPRLARELAALTVRHGQRAADLLAARAQASVLVSGSTAVGVHVAALLAAAGVGRIHCDAAGTARLRDAMPGGVEPGDEGSELALAADTAIRRAAPESVPAPADRPPRLTLLATDEPVDDRRRAALHAAQTPHLSLSVTGDHGAVGPLVVPGLTSCLRCADLHRRDRDAAWPALAVQLAIPPARGPAVDVALATVLAGTAALQALRFLDGDAPDCLEASLEMELPDWRLRRRSRPPHPDCDCLASG